MDIYAFTQAGSSYQYCHPDSPICTFSYPCHYIIHHSPSAYNLDIPSEIHSQ
jgi:hypothetical protein